VDETVRVLIRIRVERADEELGAARMLIDSGFYRIASSRAYYAAFLMASAVLLTLDVTRAKHSGVEGAFHQLLIKAGRIEVEYGQLYTLLRKTREDSDYNERVVATLDMARQRLEDAERFTARLKEYLREVGVIG
jgi:uncharacterized protein (UPF0332 family)